VWWHNSLRGGVVAERPVTQQWVAGFSFIPKWWGKIDLPCYWGVVPPKVAGLGNYGIASQIQQILCRIFFLFFLDFLLDG